ncbi:MAG: hypothetical protein CM1200mP2_55450 [Planctomycetaceae bacterium]|nr:MAG: hypothetical protein CM1200mP2_55450 [Planctomycetaceae bacterium]
MRFLEHLESVYFTFVEEVEGFEWPEVPEHNLLTGWSTRAEISEDRSLTHMRDGVFLAVHLD